jgi:hypothetical protein
MQNASAPRNQCPTGKYSRGLSKYRSAFWGWQFERFQEHSTDRLLGDEMCLKKIKSPVINLTVFPASSVRLILLCLVSITAPASEWTGTWACSISSDRGMNMQISKNRKSER